MAEKTVHRSYSSTAQEKHNSTFKQTETSGPAVNYQRAHRDKTVLPGTVMDTDWLLIWGAGRSASCQITARSHAADGSSRSLPSQKGCLLVWALLDMDVWAGTILWAAMFHEAARRRVETWKLAEKRFDSILPRLELVSPRGWSGFLFFFSQSVSKRSPSFFFLESKVITQTIPLNWMINHKQKTKIWPVTAVPHVVTWYEWNDGNIVRFWFFWWKTICICLRWAHSQC